MSKERLDALNKGLEQTIEGIEPLISEAIHASDDPSLNKFLTGVLNNYMHINKELTKVLEEWT